MRDPFAARHPRRRGDSAADREYLPAVGRHHSRVRLTEIGQTLLLCVLISGVAWLTIVAAILVLLD
jgi:hypothetical protein